MFDKLLAPWKAISKNALGSYFAERSWEAASEFNVSNVVHAITNNDKDRRKNPEFE